MKEERTGGRKREREIELGRGLRKGNGGDTGRNDEHKEVIVTKRNQFFYQKQLLSFPYICSFIESKNRRKKRIGGVISPQRKLRQLRAMLASFCDRLHAVSLFHVRRL